MENKKTTQRILLGVFVFTGSIFFLLGSYLIGKKQNLFVNTSNIVSVFNNVNGLQEGNNVRYAGVNVGIVKNITLVNDTSISVEMAIDDQILRLMRKNSQAAISSDGLVGSMVINIMPGDEKNGMLSPLQEGDTISSEKKIAAADMLEILNNTNKNAAQLTEDLLKITSAINQVQGVLGVLIHDEKVASDFRTTISNFNTSSKIALGTINQLNSELSEINFNQSVAGVLLKDSVTANNITRLIENLEQSSREINDISSEIKDFSRSLTMEKGAFNYIIKDTSLPVQLNKTVQNMEMASKNLNENMEALKHNFLFRGYFRKLERKQRKENK